MLCNASDSIVETYQYGYMWLTTHVWYKLCNFHYIGQNKVTSQLCKYSLQKKHFHYQLKHVMVNLFEEIIAFSTVPSAPFERMFLKMFVLDTSYGN